MEARNTFGATEKLKLTKEIDRLFSKGRWLRSEHIRMVYLISDEVDRIPPCQVLFSAAKKQHRRAVKRNLLKRRMRESYRLEKNKFYTEIEDFKGKLVLGFIYSSGDIVGYAEIDKELRKLMAQVVSRISKIES